MSVDSFQQNNEKMVNQYPDIVYTLEPIIPYITQLLRIIQWKEGYARQSMTVILIWTIELFHPHLAFYTLPIWISLFIHYYSTMENANGMQKKHNSDEKLTVELKEIQTEISLILPSAELKYKFRQWCRRRSQFVLDLNIYLQIFYSLSLYIIWIVTLNGIGMNKIIWFLGCLAFSWNSPFAKIICYSYHRASFLFKQNNNKNNKINQQFLNNTTKAHHDGFDRFYHFTVIEHNRWWLHCGWSSLLLSNERPQWSDEYLAQVPSIQTFQLPPSTTRVDKITQKTIKVTWEWVSKEWQIDDNRNVDKHGWEYGSFDWKSWSTKPSGLRVLTRRRHWVRNARFVEEVVEPFNNIDNQSIMTIRTTPAISIPIKLTKTTTCASLTTSLSSEESFFPPTPTASPTMFHTKSSSTSAINLEYHVEPSIFSDTHSTVESLWLRR